MPPEEQVGVFACVYSRFDLSCCLVTVRPNIRGLAISVTITMVT